ncbi:(deoxy)nucleoside triphosphate pyrophosphohydrolase [Microbacterium sp. NPDC055903]
MDNVLQVAAAAILKDGHVLACRRRAGKAAGGKWEFPGGKIEAGETAEEAVRREISEELGIEIRVLGEVATSDTLVGERTIRLICLHAELVGEPSESSTDHDRMVWTALQDLGDLDWAAPDLPAVDLLMTGRLWAQ